MKEDDLLYSILAKKIMRKIIHKIKLPAKNITNCTFGGKYNSELFVTSAKKSMTKKEIKNFKLSGSLFKIHTNMKGKSIKKFNYI